MGAVVLVYGERGSRANPQVEARVYVANGDGTLTHHVAARGRAWARTLRDRVGALLGQGVTAVPGRPDLSSVSDEALLDEARRRGLI